jgi:hypothetical protein
LGADPIFEIPLNLLYCRCVIVFFAQLLERTKVRLITQACRLECREECIRLFVLWFVRRCRQSGKSESLALNEFAVEDVRQFVDDTHVGT